jgi:LmbE family N-acetylglucosaminyl deacetylase
VKRQPTLLRLSLTALVFVLAFSFPGSLVKARPQGLGGESGEVGLGLLLRALGNVGVFLETTAHPDDENSALLAALGRGLGIRTTLLTTTRGSGGQNEIGLELFESLAVLRTEELAAVHRWDGAEQYFARAIDFGYSFSVDETYRKWGRQEILSDYVRMIRQIRPDVVMTMPPEGELGGAHHQAQARITGEAFRLAADPSAFPDQLKEGLRPWQARKLYYMVGFMVRDDAPRVAGQLLVKADVYDPLLGQTYAEIGLQARSNHKCQGMAQLLFVPGAPSATTYRLGDTTLDGGAGRPDAAMFDGIDTSIAGLARYAKAPAPEALVSGLDRIATEVDRARRALETHGPSAACEPLAAGLAAVRALRARLGAIGLDEGARFEIDNRLETKENQFARAAVVAQAVRIDVLADDGVVIGGQPVRVQVVVANRGSADLTVKRVTLVGFDPNVGCGGAVVKGGGVMPRCEVAVTVPADARPSGPYWHPLPGTARYEFDQDVPFGVPFRPTPFRARIEIVVAGADIVVDQPVEYRYSGTIFSGEKRTPLLVVPRFSVTTSPDIAIVPAGSRVGGGADREVRVSVVNGGKGAASAEVSLQVPAGWGVSPAVVPVLFTREDASETVRFSVSPPSGARPGQYEVKANVRANGATFDEGYEVIEYPHIRRQHRMLPARTTIKVIDVKVAPDLKVGYIMGVGDQVPSALAQLGARVDLIDPDALAWGDLSRYDAIVTGVRAYERRNDLKANNRRLIDYVERGGTVIVQYNKPTDFNDAQYGPYPATISSARVTDESAPVHVLEPGNAVLSFPNTIGPAAWDGWVQERGLSFLGDKDSRYVDLVQMADPFPANAGVKRGALVEASVGKGHWVYVGLGLWRQLPAGTDGAYQIFANLISLGRAPRPAGVQPLR